MNVPATMVRKATWGLSCLALALVLGAGCGDDEGPTDPPDGGNGSIDLALSPTSVSLIQGESDSTRITLTRRGGFDGAVELSIEHAPAGVTATFSPDTIPAGSATSRLTLSAAANADTGSHQLTVRARAAGVSDRTATLTLTISPQPTPDFRIVLEKGRANLVQGQEGLVGLTVERLNGFDGPLSLSLEGAPDGMTALLILDDEAHPSEGEVGIALERHVHVGDHTLTVRAVSGNLTRTAELVVRVFQSRPVAAAWSYSLAIADDGTLWSWGKNDHGQLGLGDTTDRNAPVRVSADTTWVAVAAGHAHSIALKSDGSLWVVGDNGYGQLGIPGEQYSTLQRVGTDDDWVAIGAGDDFTLAIKADRSLWTWGRNRFGQLGRGDYAQEDVPGRVPGSGWVLAAGGADHAVAIKEDGSLWAWGVNTYGQLGNGTTQGYVPQPQRVGADNDWLLASAGVGGGAIVAIKADGTLWGWGRNISGELGLNGQEALTPRKLGPANDWVDVATGSGFTIALKADGILWASGANARGRLGIPDESNYYEFTQVPGSGWQYVATGDSHALAIGPEGALYSWGSNQFGELGQGTSDIQGNGMVQGFVVRWP